jgi:hypothetical protein
MASKKTRMGLDNMKSASPGANDKVCSSSRRREKDWCQNGYQPCDEEAWSQHGSRQKPRWLT